MTEPTRRLLSSLGLLVLRLGFGGFLAFGHGWQKLSNFGAMSLKFSDPIGIGHTGSLVLAVFGEFFCSLAILFGFATRLAAIPPLITMLVAAFLIHTDDPWAKQEHALLFAIPFVALIFTGAGSISLDAVIGRWWQKRRQPQPGRKVG